MKGSDQPSTVALDRRELIKAAGVGAGALALPSAVLAQPASRTSETPGDELTARLGADLRRHAELGVKVTGGDGDLSTADWIAARLKDISFAVEQPRFDAPFFATSRSVLTVGEETIGVVAQPIVVKTGPEGITAPLAVVRETDDAADARERIALVVLPYGRWAAIWSPAIGSLIKAAAEAGAKAVVIVTTGPSREAVLLNTRVSAPFVPLPVAILPPKNARRLLAAARVGTPVTLVVDGSNGRRETCNVIGRLVRGPRWLVLSTPRTGWGPCVGERGTSTAAFLAIAAWAAQQFPDLSIFAMNSGAHEFDFDGTHRAMNAAPRPSDTALWAHIGAGLATLDYAEIGGRLTPLPSADSNRVLMGTENLLPILGRTFDGITGLERPRPIIAGAGELSGIVERGYRSAFAALGVHRWFHTSEDTLDKVDPGLLTPVVRAHQQAIELILSA
jgi:hypothetical protein